MENIRIFFFVLSTDNMILQVVTVNLAGIILNKSLKSFQTQKAIINVNPHRHSSAHHFPTLHPTNSISQGILRQGITLIRSHSNVIHQIVECLSSQRNDCWITRVRFTVWASHVKNVGKVSGAGHLATVMFLLSINNN